MNVFNRSVIAVLCLVFSVVVQAQRDFSDSDITKVVMLGTGTPNPDPTQSGCSIAIVVNDTPYIIDFGPGLIRQAASQSPLYGGKVKGLQTKRIKRAFLTHMHSDHTTGYPDLILTPWTMGRDEPLEVYGPEGITQLTDKVLDAYRDDIQYRLYGEEPANNQGWRVNSHEILAEGVVYKDDNVTVEAFPVPHGKWPNAWGYRFTTPDKVIVISGDTSASEKVMEYATGADILIHEVYLQRTYARKNSFWKKYHLENHTSSFELAEIADEAQPKMLVLYHMLLWGGKAEELEKEISEFYDGKVIAAQDLDIF